MFVVTLLANELVAWMRRQSGTTSLRALFYMDEVFGYFPPTAMPPSKLPLLTLMKQARAFGLGVVLATQNPVDLDYKGLGNAGTWFIGRLQTERDKARVIEGLLGSDAAGGMDKAQLEALMSNLPQRTFLMRNVHDDAPVLLRTRWALSYLRGPLTLGRDRAGWPRHDGDGRPRPPARALPATGLLVPPRRTRRRTASRQSRPIVPAGVPERFLRGRRQPGRRVRAAHRRARARALRRREGRPRCLGELVLPRAADRAGPRLGRRPRSATRTPIQLLDAPAADATLRRRRRQRAVAAKAFAQHGKSLADHVYRTSSLSTACAAPTLKLTSAPGGSESEFRAHVAQALREKRDAAVDALRRKYASKLDTLEDRARKAGTEARARKGAGEPADDVVRAQRRRQPARRAVRRPPRQRVRQGVDRRAQRGPHRQGARPTSRMPKPTSTALQQQHAALEAELADEIAALESKFDAGAIARGAVARSRPRKSDTEVDGSGARLAAGLT